jgi:hypothetical protein
LVHLPEKHESLWIVTVAPAIWSVHFLASYITVAIWCEKVAGRDGSLFGARVAIAVYTVIALIGIAITGYIAYRRHRTVEGERPHDSDTPEDRHLFLGFATLLLSGLSAVAVVFDALPAVLIGSCR